MSRCPDPLARRPARRAEPLAAALLLALCACAEPSGTTPSPTDQPPPSALVRRPVQRSPEVRTARHADAPPLRLLPGEPSRRPPGLEHEPGKVPHVPQPGRTPPLRDPHAQTAKPAAVPTDLSRLGPLAPAVGATFSGLGDSLAGFLVDSSPPDANGAVGPNHFVQMVNSSFAVFDKAGGLLSGPHAIHTLFTALGGECAADDDGDPIVLYDQLADRWLLSQFAVSQTVDTAHYYECVAISKTSDPTGGYTAYAFPYDAFNDYPKLSLWPDAYYATYNLFAGVNGDWAGGLVCALDRARMLAGQAATQQCFNVGTSFGGLLTAHLDGLRPPPAGAPNIVLALGSGIGDLAAWSFHVDWANAASSTLAGPLVLPTDYRFPCDNLATSQDCVPQKGQLGDAALLDTLGDRLMYRLAYRNFGDHEALAANHSVEVTPNGPLGIRWYELRLDGARDPVIYQQGTFLGSDGAYRWLGSAAFDAAGGLAVGYSISSSSTYPGLRIAGRVASDPLGTLGQGESTFFSGGGSQGLGTATVNRWGDYAALVVDPSDDCTFWFTSEYLPTSGSFNWDTRVGTFRLPGCPASASSTAADFGLTVEPARALLLSGSTTQLTALTSASGTPVPVVLSVADLPPGVTGAFSPVQLLSGGASTLTLTAAATAPTSTGASLRVTGLGPTSQRTALALLDVQGGAGSSTRPDFSLAVLPGSLTLTAPGSATATVFTTLTGGAAGTVVLSAAGLPAGLTARFSPESVLPGSSSVLTLAAAPGALSGAFDVSGSSSAALRTVRLFASVVADFTLALSETSTLLHAGKPAVIAVQTRPLAAGTLPILQLSLVGLPPGVTFAFSPASVTAGGSSTLALSATLDAAGGTTAYTLLAADGAARHAAAGSLTVANDFDLSLSTSTPAVVAGARAVVQIATRRTSGSAETVSLAATGLPGSLAATFAPASLAAGQGSTLTLEAASGTPGGLYPLLVAATATSATHAVAATLSVAGPDTGPDAGSDAGPGQARAASGCGSAGLSPWGLAGLLALARCKAWRKRRPSIP